MDLSSSFDNSGDDTTKAIYDVIRTLDWVGPDDANDPESGYDAITAQDSDIDDLPDLHPDDLQDARDTPATTPEVIIVPSRELEQPQSSTGGVAPIVASDQRRPSSAQARYGEPTNIADPAKELERDEHGSGQTTGEDRNKVLDGMPARLAEQADHDAEREAGDSHRLDGPDNSAGAEESPRLAAPSARERMEASEPDQRVPTGNLAEDSASLDAPPIKAGKESPLVTAALGFLKSNPGQYESFKEQLEGFDKLDDKAQEQAASKIWEFAAEVVCHVVTEQNLLRAYQDGLIKWWEDPSREVSTEKEVRERHPFVAWVLDTMKELAEDVLEEAVQAAVIELLFPGAHLIFPPTNLVAALFTAFGIEDLADGAA